jgi:predicted HTH transcriptional regulator
LSDDAWLWLRLDDDWLDYRSLGAYEAAVNQDVRDERSVDSELDLAAMIAQGEGQQLEFKRRLPEHTAPSRRSALKTVVAFANGDGGTLFYGVDDDGTVVGIEGGNDRTPDQFNDLLRSWTAPMPSFEARVERVNEMVVLVVDVNGDSGTIHALTLDSDKPEYYVRRGATTFYARPEELQAIAANRGTPDHQAWNSMF